MTTRSRIHKKFDQNVWHGFSLFCGFDLLVLVLLWRKKREVLLHILYEIGKTVSSCFFCVRLNAGRIEITTKCLGLISLSVLPDNVFVQLNMTIGKVVY